MAEIELICPGCGADYALPDGALPPAGREVECSRCGHVWRATPPAPEGPMDLGRYSRVAGVASPRPAARGPVAERSALPDADEDDRPAAVPLPPASKRLSPDLLDLLRGEVDREKRLREAEVGGTVPEPPKPAAAAVTDAVPLPALTPDREENGISHATDPGDEIDWPATTVTLPAGSSRGMTPTAQPPVLLTPARAPEPEAAQAPVLLTPRPQPAPARRPEPVPAATRREPLPAARAGHLRADASASDRSRSAARPAQAARTRHRGYRLGLGLAALLVVLILAVYLLAPMLQPEDGPVARTLSAWRSDLDLARLWLDAQVRRLIP